jgi:hypothetical protein
MEAGFGKPRRSLFHAIEVGGQVKAESRGATVRPSPPWRRLIQFENPFEQFSTGRFITSQHVDDRPSERGRNSEHARVFSDALKQEAELIG